MPIESVACGEEHTIILTSEGKLVGLGSNASGQLGVPINKAPTPKNASDNFDGDETNRSVTNQNRHCEPIPIEIKGLACKIVKVACGEQHTLALTLRGQVYSWGQARYGQLGIDFNL
jgi:alpha-tubulin suppressor-like RCC1 family protein